MLYIFVDPSGNFNEGKGHTGIASMTDDNWESLVLEDIAAKNYKSQMEYWHAVIGSIKALALMYGTKSCHIIIESFQIRTNGFLLGKMPETIMLIGALVWELSMLNISYTFQTPSQAKSRFKDDLLPRYIPNFEKRENGRFYYNGKQTNDHIRDALKHLLYYKKYCKPKEE